MYQLVPDTYAGPSQCVRHVTDGAMIPFDEANTDYAAYLQWLSEGNTPISADEE